MKIPFIKMNGLGNDFVILEDLSKNIPINKSLIKKMSSRQYGIGCDQLLIIKEFSGDEALVDIYNSDGSLVGACGNGVRCVASHLMEKSYLIEFLSEQRKTDWSVGRKKKIFA